MSDQLTEKIACRLKFFDSNHELYFLFILCCISFSAAIPIDNGVEGDPKLICGSASLIVQFRTINSIEGRVYIKGLYKEYECRNDTSNTTEASIEIPLNRCNLARIRSLEPRGIFVTTSVVISFHPYFITKVDRAYRIQCFYMEADKTVSVDASVSEMTSALHMQPMNMPICKYEVNFLNI